MHVEEHLRANLEWLKRFQKEKSRPLRVLHIGNVANNAYINAKIMRKYGIEADVLCNDYYDKMGCPEWEDPGLRRPIWFVQGPLNACLNYLQGYHCEVSKFRMKWHQLVLYKNRITKGYSFSKKILNIYISFYSSILLILSRKKIFHSKRIIKILAPIVNLLLINKLYADICLEGEGVEKELLEYCKFSEKQFEKFKVVLSYYDLIQTYGIHPLALLLLKSRRKYFAYEHGTLRDIPFKEDFYGKLSRLVYKQADGVFITNIDCLNSARNMNLDFDRVVALPHAFDSQKVDDFFTKHKAVQIAKNPFIFIAPARHHWLHGDLTWLKANHLVIKAVNILKELGVNSFKILFIKWGQEVNKSLELINELDINEYFVWSKPFDKKKLWMHYTKSIAVLDQFAIPAMGSITFEALALGKRTVSRLDVEASQEFFGNVPPIYNCSDHKMIADSMLDILEDPYDTKKIGELSRDWIEKNHSSQVLLNKQIRRYRDFL